MHRCLKTGDDRPEEILKKRLIVDGPVILILMTFKTCNISQITKLGSFNIKTLSD